MASKVLYPPIVDGFMPSFVAGPDNKCRVYFSLSKFNSETEFKNIHVAVTKQATGENCIKAFDDDVIYRMSGIMLNVPFVKDKENIYYIDLDNINLNTSDSGYNGWCPGWIYKIQLRLSNAIYDPSEGKGQSTWLVEHGSDFSEWSTVCVVKPIGEPLITFTSIKDDGKILGEEIIGNYSCPDDSSETLYSYRFKLYKDGKLLDDSGNILPDANIDNQKINYVLKVSLENGNYQLDFSYKTLNDYEFSESIDLYYEGNIQSSTNIEIMTLDTAYDIKGGKEIFYHKYFDSITKYEEEEDGRISYYLYGNDELSSDISGIYYIRRTDSKSNFTRWEDIKKLELKAEGGIIFVDDIYFDYTAESGVFYRYGIQAVDNSGRRGKLMKMHIGGDEPSEKVQSIRDYSYSYLLGENEQQLRLSYDDALSSYKVTVNDSTTATLGGKYPFVVRSGNNHYKTFAISGLISFNSDENKIFLQDKELYQYDEIAELYAERGASLGAYDYTHEKEYRNKVIEFLNDGKPKLYKSLTEGNIIVRITDVNLTPNNQLDRLIYSFTATATEIAEYNLKNLFKYKIVSLEDSYNKSMPIRYGKVHSHN